MEHEKIVRLVSIQKGFHVVRAPLVGMRRMKLLIPFVMAAALQAIIVMKHLHLRHKICVVLASGAVLVLPQLHRISVHSAIIALQDVPVLCLVPRENMALKRVYRLIRVPDYVLPLITALWPPSHQRKLFAQQAHTVPLGRSAPSSVPPEVSAPSQV